MTKLVSKKELKTIMGVPYSGAHIARLEAVGRFPKRIKLGPNRVAWIEAEIEKWIAERVAASREPNGDPSTSGGK